MDAEFRKEQFKKLPPKALKRIILPELNREYTLSEIAIITSAGPARALGLPQKGHLGVGADADVAIYNESKDVVQMFAYPRYVIKGGEVVIEEGEIRKTVEGKGFARASHLRREDRGLHPPAVPAVLHDVVRQLPGRDGTHRTPGGPSVPATELDEQDDPHAEGTPHRPAGGRGPLAGRDRAAGPRRGACACRCSWASGSTAWTTSSTSRAPAATSWRSAATRAG